MVAYGSTQLDALVALWETQGLFSVFLPFLLLFAVIFAVLNKSKILGGKTGIDMIVALSVGLLALQQQFMQRFFAELFPRLGMGVGVMLTLMILVGLFIVKDKNENIWMTILGSVAAIVFFVVILSTQGGFSIGASSWWMQWGNIVVWGIVLVGIIVAFSLSNKHPKSA
ncbi:MAG: hypothetical protein V1660_01865 [archaeon]